MQRWHGLTFASVVLATACLPQDTRPPPAEVTVTVSASELTLSDIPAASTADGYDIHLERLLVNLGQEDVGGGDGVTGCSEYSSPGYTRLFDFKHVKTPLELGLAYAAGHCPFGFTLRFPNLETKLGAGANEDDRTLMRTPGSDPIAMDDGISVYIAGSGERGDERKHFAWALRRRIRFSDCGVPTSNGILTTGLDLPSDGKTHVNIEIQGEALFRGSGLDALAHFAPYAQADADGDGEIALAELWTVPVQAVKDAGLIEAPDPPRPPSDARTPDTGKCVNDDGDDVVVKTLGDFLYCTLLKDIARYEGNGSCTTVIGRPPRD